MAAIHVCDVCRSNGKLVETTRYRSVKGRPELRLDVCDACDKTVPKNMTEYVKLVYRTKGVELSDEDAKKIAGR